MPLRTFEIINVLELFHVLIIFESTGSFNDFKISFYMKTVITTSTFV